MDGRKCGQLRSFNADGRRHAFVTPRRWFAMPAVLPRCRVLVLRTCMPWPPVRPCKAAMPPFLSLHATLSLCVSCPIRRIFLYSPGALLQSGYPAFLLAACCSCTPPTRPGLSPSNWLHPSGAYPAPASGRDIGHPRILLSLCVVARGEQCMAFLAACRSALWASTQA